MVGGKVGKNFTPLNLFRFNRVNSKHMTDQEIEGKIIGRVSHYFSNIGVAVIELQAPLNKGDTIRIVGGVDTDFEQKVESMEVEHKRVDKAKKGESVGLKVKERVRDGYKVYKQ